MTSVHMDVMHTSDDLWERAVQTFLDRMKPEDTLWLNSVANRRAFTSTEIVAYFKPLLREYAAHPVQRFLARVDPIVSHIQSFSGAIDSFANAGPLGAGIIWGSIRLVFIVASKTQQSLECILDFLSDLGSQLALFARWDQLFPRRSYIEVGDAICSAYFETLAFCATAVRHLRRNPLVTIFHAAFYPTMEQALQKHQARLRRCTARVREEVEEAQARFVHQMLVSIHSRLDNTAGPTPRLAELPSARVIPHAPNERFFGRQDILDRMAAHLQPRSWLAAQVGEAGEAGESATPPPLLPPSGQPKQRTIALCGSGGTGKTQIALEYTYRHLNDYKVVLWLMADSLDKVNQGFREAAELLGVAGTQSDRRTRILVLKHLSESDEPYLLCFDNVDDLGLIRDLCFPRDNTGTIIITSRDSVGGIAEKVLVPEFSILEGSRFLGAMLPEAAAGGPENERVLLDISTTFHGYPLALAQAAAFIQSDGCAPAGFLALFRNRSNARAIASLPIVDYHATLSTVLDLSFMSLGGNARQILDMLVYLDPDSIPCDLFASGCAALDDDDDDDGDGDGLHYMADHMALNDAFKGLQHQSLIRRNPTLKTISIHRFLQDQALERLRADPTRRLRAFRQTLFVLSHCQPVFPNVTQHWSPDLFKASESCLAHITRLTVRYQEAPAVFAGLENKLGKLIFECASYQFERFHHDAAAKSFSLARDVIGRAAEPNELYLSDCYRMEGRMFNESGEPLQAAQSNRMAQEHAQKAMQKGYIDHTDQRMPRILTGLGNSLSQLGQFDQALEAQLEAKKLCGDVPPDQSDAITIVQLNLGFLLYRRGDLHNAEQILRAALDLSPDTAPALYALGNTLLAKGQVDEAIAVHLRGLDIYRDMFDEKHALVGRCTYKVGEMLLLHKKDPATARTYIQKAISIYQNQESPYYTVTACARALHMLARACEEEGLLQDAQRHKSQAWRLRKKREDVYGPLSDDDMDYAAVMFYWDQ